MLSFAKGIGVNHNAWEGGSDEYVAVMKVEDNEPKQEETSYGDEHGENKSRRPTVCRDY